MPSSSNFSILTSAMKSVAVLSMPVIFNTLLMESPLEGKSLAGIAVELLRR